MSIQLISLTAVAALLDVQLLKTEVKGKDGSTKPNAMLSAVKADVLISTDIQLPAVLSAWNISSMSVVIGQPHLITARVHSAAAFRVSYS